MLTSQLVDEAIRVAEAQGFEVRYEHLGGVGTGYCQLDEKRWVVVDVAQAADEQLEQLSIAIATKPIPPEVELSKPLASLVSGRSSTQQP